MIPTQPNRAQNDTGAAVDDEFRALLEGLRTTLPGVQVLFAFLLALPLQSAFAELAGPPRSAYYVALYSSALASVLLIAPSAHQRLCAPHSGVRRRSDDHLTTAVRMTIGGTILFLIALSASVYLVSDVMLPRSAAIAATAVVAMLAAWSWFYVPLVSFRRR